MCDKCNHTQQYNTHGPDQNDYGFNNGTNEVEYLGSCQYCKVCRPSGLYGNYILEKMTGKQYLQLTKDEQNSLWIEYNEELEEET